MIEVPKVNVEVEVLPSDAVRVLHDRFMKGIEEKAERAIPADAPTPDVYKRLLTKLLIASAEKAIELNADQLAALAREGLAAIQQRTWEVSLTLHKSIAPEWTSYPSPNFTPAQNRRLAEAAEKREDEDAVKNLFEGQDRLYLKLKGEVEGPQSKTQQMVNIYLSVRGYKITDYVKGYATDAAGKQQFRIGKLLKDSEFYQAFTEDSSRTLGSLMVVISRKAEDIARMSTGRAWASCMGSGGFNFKYVPKDIEKGTLIAYLISEKDPDIVNPLARILIKPFVEKKHRASALTAAAMRVFGIPDKRPRLYVPNKTYGIHNDAFTAAVHGFINDKLNREKEGKFVLPAGLYPDGGAVAYVRHYGQLQETYR